MVYLVLVEARVRWTEKKSDYSLHERRVHGNVEVLCWHAYRDKMLRAYSGGMALSEARVVFPVTVLWLKRHLGYRNRSVW